MTNVWNGMVIFFDDHYLDVVVSVNCLSNIWLHLLFKMGQNTVAAT